MPSVAHDLLRPLACVPGVEDPPSRADRPAHAVHVGAAPEITAADELGVLYRRHHQLVFRLALRYGRGDAAWAEDVTQDVFLGLFKILGELTDRDGMEGWLYRATTNRCLNRLRHERFLNLAPVRWLIGERHLAPRPPDELVMARADLRRAFEILDVLPPKERVAFSMYYLDGQDQDAIGTVLGHSRSYVCKLIQRAVARLRGAGWEVDHVE
ncbi:MAG: sigma-70 family RNA polymerase sigma factor [Byssovorax sp.]